MEQSDTRNPIEELAAEFIERRRNGEQPTIDEYLANNPELADEIAELFPTLQMMESVRSGVGRSREAHHADIKQAGDHVGDFELIREIGRGGMGVVFEAQQRSLGRRVALKILTPSLTRSQRYVERFSREARAAANLQHRNIVPVFGVGEEDGIHYYVMQFIYGRGLDHVLKALQAGDGESGNVDKDPFPGGELNNPCSPEELALSLATGDFEPSAYAPAVQNADGDSSMASAFQLSGAESGSGASGSAQADYFERVARLGAAVADGLEYAHDCGVLHRDIKPSNLLFDITGNIWLTDFGLAKIEGEGDLTETGDLLGTLRYIAPESLRGESDCRTDVYGLGLTLYELVTRKPAFTMRDRAETIRSIMEIGPPGISKQNVDVPRDLERVIQKAIEIQPNDRYSTAGALAEDLWRFVRHEPVEARRIGWFERTSRWTRRNSALAVSIGLVFCLLVVGLLGSAAAYFRLDQLSGDRKDALDVASVERADAQRSLVEANIVRAESIAGSGQQGQRLDGLRAIEESVPIARSLLMGDDVIARLRNAAIACMASPDLHAIDETRLTDSFDFNIHINREFTHYAFQQDGIGGPILVRRLSDHHEVKAFDQLGRRLVGRGLLLSPNAKYLATIHDEPSKYVVVVTDVATEREVLQAALRRDWPADGLIAFDHESNRFAVAPRGGGVDVYSLPDGEVESELLPSNRIDCVCFGQDSSDLVVARTIARIPRLSDIISSKTKTSNVVLEAYDVRNRTRKFQIELPAAIDTMATSPANLIAAASAQAIWIVDPELAEVVTRINHDISGIQHIGFDSTGKILGVGHSSRSELWCAQTGTELLRRRGTMIAVGPTQVAYKLHPGRLGVCEIVCSDAYVGIGQDRIFAETASIDPTSRVLFTGHRFDFGTGIKVWDLVSGKLLGRVPIDHVTCLKMNSSHTKFYCVTRRLSSKREIHEWPIAMDGTEVRIGPAKKLAVPDDVLPLHIALDGADKLLAVDGKYSGYVGLYDLNRDSYTQWKGPYAQLGIDITPNGKAIATGTWHGNDACIFDVKTHKLIRKFKVGQTLVRFSPDNRFLFCRDGVYELGSWKEMTLQPSGVDFAFDQVMFAAQNSIAILPRFNPPTSTFVFNMKTWKPLAQLATNRLDEHFGHASVVSADASTIAAVVFEPNRNRQGVHGYHVAQWDMRSLRKHLRELDLDFDCPPLPSRPKLPAITKLTVDLGEYGEAP